MTAGLPFAFAPFVSAAALFVPSPLASDVLFEVAPFAGGATPRAVAVGFRLSTTGGGAIVYVLGGPATGPGAPASAAAGPFCVSALEAASAGAASEPVPAGAAPLGGSGSRGGVRDHAPSMELSSPAFESIVPVKVLLTWIVRT
jgi:hypothetical protein